MTTTDYRLPRDIVPVDYDITLDASPRRATFKGQLVLTARVKRKTDRLELHARGLKIDHAVLKSGRRKIPLAVQQQSERETVELLADAPLTRGELVVHLDFRGKLNPSMHGLYLAKDGPERAIVSQCEATDARAIFPCFDEPDFKATLCWTVHTDPGYVVITNGVLQGRRRARTKPVRDVHRFQRTRVIPTYLAAITIGKYESSPMREVAGTPCRSWSGVGKAAQTAFAQDVTAQVLPWYQKYFGQKYNYQKLDQVAVPGFDAGAMENVGAIFYRQSLLLMDTATTSWNAQKRIAEVIAHEIAHQWFGNLVTMAWWDDLWLNEAFATWIAYKAVDEWHPEWRMWDDFLASKESALEADALHSTHPVYTEVKSPAEATELFDIITYEKGCGILRMIESYLGAEVFRDGIRRYQKAFKNKNAQGADLWGKLKEASNQPVDALMRSWVTQTGFPVVDVGWDGNRLLLQQSRFFADADARVGDAVWMIPMVVRYGVQTASGISCRTRRVLLKKREMSVKLPLKRGEKLVWAYPNADSTGFYRLAFSLEALEQLLEHGVEHLSPAERKSLLEDSWACVRSGRRDIGRFMQVLTALRDETDYVVVRAMAGRVHNLAHQLVSDDDRPLFSALVRDLFGAQFEALGWEGAEDEAPGEKVRRAALLRVLGEIGRDTAFLREVEAKAAIERETPDAIDANIAGAVVSLAALRGNKATLSTYVDTYQARKKEGTAPDVQARYVGALAAFEKKDVVKAVHALCLDGTVPQEQLRSVLVSQLLRRETQQATWRFLKKNWETIAPQIGSMGISRLVESTGALPPEMDKEVRAFFAKNPVDEAVRALAKALEAMALRRALQARESKRLSAWLRAHVGSVERCAS